MSHDRPQQSRLWTPWLTISHSLSAQSLSAHLQTEDKVAADTLLSDDVLHGAKRGAQVGVEQLGGQQTHRGGHQVVWQGHVRDLKMEVVIRNKIDMLIK